ncbi:MAG: anhydro-N-acetylmuramic acid kinase [Rubritepida sp.]|nr:anhydro-N-acetylmuramic acid kinase [Rubritepida sp.]MCU0944149.1 anhydro-N-acetylmuramic acid kinase [Rubritepida sp.]
MRIVGLMSGTSLDGVDAAWVETDGERVGALGPTLTLPYEPALRRDLRRLLELAPTIGAEDPFLRDVTARLTERHVEAVARLRAEAAKAGLAEPELLGFHGQTILHRPLRPGDGANARGFTWQIGDAQALARRSGLSVAFDFRSADVAAGGQGAPLVPIAHAALAAGLPKPLAVLNLGGVGNVTWLGPDGRLLAFDTGPANGPLDDWAKRSTGRDYDRDGNLALAGQVDGAVLGRLMAHPYLEAPPPKSLDRLDFDRALREAGAHLLSPQDGAATLVAFAAVCVAAAARHFPEPPLHWLVAGGGRRNPAMMRALASTLSEPVRAVEVAGWDGDALEAQCFAVLAARTARGLPISFPETTGVPRAMAGGRVLGGLL